MKKKLLILIVISCVQLFAQEEISKFDVRFGIGKSLLGTGDMNTWCFENELNYRISNYFSSSASIAYASSNDGVY